MLLIQNRFSVEVINPLFLLTAKSVIYSVNLSENDYIRQKNKHLSKIAEWVKEHASGDAILSLFIAFEERLTRLENDEEAAEECKKLSTKSALPKIIMTMRQMLGLESFFTTGTDEVRQWAIRKGTKAPQAARVIHGGRCTPLVNARDWLMRTLPDFEKTFIQCIVYNYDMLKEYKDEASLKAAGKVMTKGKDYVVEVSYSEQRQRLHLNVPQEDDVILIKAGAAK